MAPGESSANSAGSAEEPQNWSIFASMAPRVNVAFHQNAVPFIAEIAVVAPLDAKDVSVRIRATPPFLRPSAFRIDAIAAGALRNIAPVPVELDLSTLAGLKEAVRAEVAVDVLVGEDQVTGAVHSVVLLSPQEWTGLSSAPELIAAFVRPNDPAVDAILRKAADKLGAAGAPRELDGYRSGKRTRAFQVAAAIWAALIDERIVYALPPQSFERDGQKVRSPSEVVARKLATCLDATLLFAACLEQAGLHPLIGFLEGHAFCGLWLADDSFPTVQIDEPQTLRKRLASRDIALIETTLLMAAAPIKLADAQAKAATYVAENPEKRFESVIDIRRARQHGVRPLALAAGAGDAPQIQIEPTATPLETVEPIEEDIVVADRRPEPADRVERWKRKLLDLSLRNKMLNFKMSKGAVAFIAPDAAGLENRIAGERPVRILAAPGLLSDGDPRDAETRLRLIGADVLRQHAVDALARDEVHAALAEEELNDRLVELYRAARLSETESGANSLHLALGFVSWTPGHAKGQSCKAPLLLVPVRLERRSARSSFRLAAHGDEARINPTLLEMMRQDFRLSMPELERELPEAQEGLDVARIWRTVRAHLKDMAGFELTEEVVLSTFSFAKYLMWKDLVERTEQLKQNPVVRHLIDTPKQTYPGATRSMPDERRLDAEVAPSQLFMPLPADSSQTAAVVAAERGHDFVLFGPPGTGKSQTIANMIVQLIAAGKTVLFVSQKTTALEVVRRRLDAIGVGDYCLEVHSAKAQKTEVLAQLKSAWERQAESIEQDWAQATESLVALRDQLNALVSALHRRRANGMSAHQAMGRVLALRDVAPELRLAFGDAAAHDEAALYSLRSTLRTLLVDIAALGEIENHPLTGVHRGAWSPTWRSDFVLAANDFIRAAAEYSVALGTAVEAFGFAPPRRVADAPAWIALALTALKPAAREGVRWLDEDSRPLRDAFAAWLNRRAACDAIAARMSGPYRNGVFALPLAEILAEHQRAAASLPILRGSRLRAVAARLAPFAEKPADVDVARDVPALLELESERQAAGAYDAAMAPLGTAWRGLDTDPASVEAAFDWEDAARVAAGRFGGDRADRLAALAALIRDRANDLSPQGPGAAALRRLAETYKALEGAQTRLERLAEAESGLGLVQDGHWLDAAATRARSWADHVQLAPRWCAYQAALRAAHEGGLAELVDRLRRGEVKPDRLIDAFEAGYARWWIDEIVESEPALSAFVADRHEDAIARFRQADQRVADLARAVVARRLAEKVPPRSAFGSDREFGVLNGEILKRRKHLPLRQLFANMPSALRRLAPCMMMSPLSIAQFLPADAKAFDVVIFDEASQIPVWDAIGAIARGGQMVVVGDPKQLPPTSFFDRSNDDSGDLDEIEDLESILDECLAASVPHKKLTWHYRSRRESLIAFSNERYYEGRLVTFPAPETQDRAVRYVHVANGVYERGGGRVNRAEAKAVVDEALARLCRAGRVETLGVVTFNAEQQRLIENMLDQARRSFPEIEPYFSPSAPEPVFVKNLESVQGDERDVILFSVGYGPDASGRVSQNFGPLNRDGGPRRLNVAVTRARSELIVFATLRPEQIDLARTRAAGVRDFKHFLEFAQQGAKALAAAAAPLDRDPDSDFEREVRAALEGSGWTVHPQVGVSGFRIDLGVVHPDAPGRYLAGIECDGATYHRSATARDRDRLRQAALENLGWRILRVWSTDWWMDRDTALERLDRQLKGELEEIAQTTADASPEDEASTTAEIRVAAPPPAPPIAAPEPEPATGFAEDPPPRLHYADPAVSVTSEPGMPKLSYQPVDLVAEGFSPQRGSFYEPTYRTKLRAMVARVIEAEGPLFEECLVSRIAEAHGFGRSGGQIRSAVIAAAGPNVRILEERSDEGARRIYWPDGRNPEAPIAFRPASRRVRDHADVPLMELAFLARDFLAKGCDREETLRRMAEHFDLARLRASTRRRFENAIGAAARHE